MVDASRSVAAGTATSILILLAACGSHWPLRAARTTGQIPDDYQPEPARALVIARIDVITDGQAGFGPIGNPMLLQFDAGEGVPREKAQGLTIPDLNARSIADPDARPFTSEAHQQRLWRYAQPGLLAMSLPPGTYDGLIIFYPDTSRLDRPVDSIPAPSRPMLFAPLRIAPDTVVYIGDIQVEQSISWTDLIFDRVEMDYAVVDRYDQTVADFRARYPQFQNAEIEKSLVAPMIGSD